MRVNQYTLIRLTSVAVLLLAWELFGRSGDSIYFPPFSAVAVALWKQLGTAQLWQAVWITMQAMLLGFGAMVVVGIPVGVLSGYFPTVQRLINPYVRFFLSTPTAPLVPVFVMLFGITLTARAATVFIFGIAILIVNAAAGVREVPTRWVEMSQSFGATTWQTIVRVIIPGSLPGILAGLRLGAGRAVVGMITAELVIVSVGLGKMIGRYSARFDAPNLFAVVIIVLAIGVIVARSIAQLERRLLRWK